MEMKSKNKELGNATYFSYSTTKMGSGVLQKHTRTEQRKVVMGALAESLPPVQFQLSVQATVGSAETSRLICLTSRDVTWEQKCR